MADDPTQHSYRSSGDRPARTPSAGGSDPLAELARLIGQNDPFGEYGSAQARRAPGSTVMQHAPEPAADWHAAPPPPSAPPRQAQVAAYRDEAPFQGHPAPFEHGLEDPNLASYESEQEDFYEDEAPRRRTGIVVVGAIFALAVIGTAGAFGYRAVFGPHGSSAPPVIKSDPAPIKVQPPKQDAKLIQERAPAPPSEKLAPPHEEPVELKNKPAGVIAPAPPMQGNGLVGSEPKKIHTITIRPDMTVADAAPVAPNAVPAAAPPPAAAVPEPAPRPTPPARVAVAPGDGNAPLSLNPNIQPSPAARPAPPARTAAVPPPARAMPPAAHNAATGGFAVQLSARRSEAEAQAAFHGLQAKFPSQLGGHQPLIRKVEINGKGTYYRTMVGPFGSSEEAAKLCSALKAAGGSCFVQRI